MLFKDTYQTIAQPSEGVFRDRGSKFIAFAFPVITEEEIKKHVLQLKAGHPKARHHCWAVRFGPDRTVFRLNDDGEPSGTAGRPILNTLLSYDVTNTLIVVVRYFGGTLLGVTGLINAYKSASIDALNQARIIEQTVNDYYLIQFDYLQMNEVMRVIKEENLSIEAQNFNNDCEIQLSIRQTQVIQAIGRLEKISNIKISYQHTA
jgi:uncharacterized YigZ family protein